MAFPIITLGLLAAPSRIVTLGLGATVEVEPVPVSTTRGILSCRRRANIQTQRRRACRR